MKPETLALQNELDPTTGAIAVEEIRYPIAVKSLTGKCKYLAISDIREIVIYEWKDSTIAADLLSKEGGTEIPAVELIAELEAILYNLKTKL
jgi:hypothetical protein